MGSIEIASALPAGLHDRAPVMPICRRLPAGLELSRGWGPLQRGEAPEELQAFFILWQERDSERFVGQGVYLSTSEPSPHLGCEAFVVYEVPIKVDPRTRAECLRRAAAVDLVELSRPFVYDSRFRQLFEKYAQDVGLSGGRRPAKPEILSDRDYADLEREFALKGA